MLKLPFYLIDAFTDQVFGGNPAAVCPLDAWLPDDVLQKMTIEHNQSETAFFVPTDTGFELRWFTVLGEINLCGHATLASAHVIFNHMHYPKNEILFSTRFVGDLSVKKDGDILTMNFPSWPPQKLDEIPPIAVEALRAQPQEGFLKRDYLFTFPHQNDILNLKPDFAVLARWAAQNPSVRLRVCVTAPGADCDFVSRFFCPGDAVEEDPVTGSAHSMLIPYWAARLGKNKLFARQLSARGGELHCELQGDRVLIGGRAKTYLTGSLSLPTK